ncbi:collagen-like protein [Streptomyces sp. H27-C3]|uniref:collagen-like protein n=1 Tax=Streptomyces sp. H27-C3 TaxID=3046305 RepID=UPI0024BA7D8F|nr:collagen-like protein [Streptomyces sp. H27-C3]MDJ0461543.1 collagen-like protein [Streptomyces sp. H27-C3]
MKRHKAPDAHRSRRGNVLAILGALLAGAALFTVQDLATDLRDANQARDQLALQVQRLGGKPVAGPPGSRGEPGRGQPGPSGPPGLDGEPGPVGLTGPVGPTGRPGDDGSDGSDGVGVPGISGTSGTDGASVVGPPGPVGPQGEPGPAGAAGEQGPPGEPGRDGSDGTDGQSCPDGYSLQPPADDPDALVCRRDAAPDPEPPQGGQPQGLDPSRRQYP